MKLRERFTRFMAGRHGLDQLSIAILYIDLGISIVALFTRATVLNLLTYVPLGYVIFRSLSRNNYQRHQENRRYLQLLERLRDKNNRYFRCPKCKQRVRVPKGKGKIAITCPRCAHRFNKRT